MNWPFVFFLRFIMLGAFIAAVILLSKKNKRKIIIGCVIGALLFLLFPYKGVYKDGGTTQYWAPLYTVIKWKRMEYPKTTEVFLFPENYKNVDELWLVSH